MKLQSQVKDYTVEIIDNAFEQFRTLLADMKFNRPFYFIDEAVYRAYQKDFEKIIGNDRHALIPATESNKDYVHLANYYRVLIDAGFQRGDLLVTFGGGILQDISGFIASTLYRGLKWAFFPTTLLAQADSCIGSKTSINFSESKNLIGTFYPPDRIYIDATFCQSLNDSYFNSGIGEVIKFHLLSDALGYQKLKEFLSLHKSTHHSKYIL